MSAKVTVESHPYAAAREIGGLHLALNPGHVVAALSPVHASGPKPGRLLVCQSCSEPLCLIDEAAP